MILSPSTWGYSESLGLLCTWSNWMAWLPAGMPRANSGLSNWLTAGLRGTFNKFLGFTWRENGRGVPLSRTLFRLQFLCIVEFGRSGFALFSERKVSCSFAGDQLPI